MRTGQFDSFRMLAVFLCILLCLVIQQLTDLFRLQTALVERNHSGIMPTMYVSSLPFHIIQNPSTTANSEPCHESPGVLNHLVDTLACDQRKVFRVNR
ncbi:hypothetical protein CALCODRAFT_19210 [Calocera cornea HHB12733]|uniref:Uncharacterized protein n=1 Tax=Calocera cornea HHB12733 TaxID=1353952 RepID=A0A165E7F1_9BASI|nr:hypothetical protein CALCODRAFT_19210 [Calocera cornea HHB12733]